MKIVGVTGLRNKCALSTRLRNLNLRSQFSILDQAKTPLNEVKSSGERAFNKNF